MTTNNDRRVFPDPTTGTGLDMLVETISSDHGLDCRISDDDIAAGAIAADAMNNIIIQGIRATGLANNGTLTAADLRDLNEWIRTNALDRWIELHGDDECNGEETGFHRVQNDGASSRLFAENAVNTVADGIYHLGFEIEHGSLLNEDGNRNVSLEKLAYWLNTLLRGDLADGSLTNGDVNPYLIDTRTGTGLDRLVETIVDDKGLNERIATSEIYAGANAAADMNALIVDAIRQTGLANDGMLTISDLHDINRWIRENALERWMELHGDDEDNGGETGFHLVQNDGASSRLLAQNAVNTVADGIYHLGFEIEHGRFLNEDGNRNVSVETLTYWLNELLADDLDNGRLGNDAVDPYRVDTSTGTGLDRLVDTIVQDEGLNQRIATSEIIAGANAAADMNALIIESIRQTGVANDGEIGKYDMYDINAWLRENALETWTSLHGDDGEEGKETGFHQVQNDGATSRLLGNNAVDTVADGLYHLGFEIRHERFVNEDGNGNVSLQTAAYWLDTLLEDELVAGRLSSPTSVDMDRLRSEAVYALDSVAVGRPGDQVEVTHEQAFELDNGTISFSFVANALTYDERDTLFSKDAYGNGEGGHISAWVHKNQVVVRLQSEDSEVWLSSGKGSIQAGRTYDFAFKFGEDGAQLYVDGSRVDAEFDFTSGISGNTEDLAIGANTWARSDRDPDWRNDYFNGEISDFMIFGRALSNAEIHAVAAAEPNPSTTASPGLMVSPTTGTGLDMLVDTINNDLGLNQRTSGEDIAAGASAADQMNQIIIQGIRETGIANDGALGASDLRDLNAWIRENALNRWIELHGDDEGNGDETGFHRVQNDGGKALLFGKKAVDTVADGIYHLGFEIKHGRFLNEDGNGNVSIEAVAHWLDSLLKKELLDGSLANADVDPYRVEHTTGTGLDTLVNTIVTDRGLNDRISTTDIYQGANAAAAMNTLIVDSIRQTGLANDGDLNIADVRDLNRWIQDNAMQAWTDLHGDDENGEETGFHLVQNDGARSRLFADNAVDTVADGIYHMGFDIDRDRFVNEDGNRNVSVETLTQWLNNLLARDLESGRLGNDAMDPYRIESKTNTGLDALVDTIVSDEGLNRRIATSEIIEGANAAAALNAIIVEAIRATGLANDGSLNMADVRDLNRWIQDNAMQEWTDLHGDDENGEETGFHLVQNDGAQSRLFATNAVDTVADGLYHMGFEIRHDRFLNEDGNSNVSVETLSHWLNELLVAELADGRLGNDAVNPYSIGTQTGTGLDALVDIIVSDEGLNRRIATSEIIEGANAAAGMNSLIVESIRQTGVANDGAIDRYDMYDMNNWLPANALDTWTSLHGDDFDDGRETGFHQVQNDGASSRLFDRNAVDTVADGLYHIGFEISEGRFLNEDGNKNVSLDTAAGWLNNLLADDFTSGALDSSQPVDAGALRNEAVYRLEALTVSGPGDQLEVTHQAAFELSNGTFSFSFTANDTDGRNTLFSKDARGNGDGGHMSAWVRDGTVQVRLQGQDDEIWLQSDRGVIAAGETYDVAFSFGNAGAQLYLDGQRVDAEFDYHTGIADNTEDMAIGVSTWARSDYDPDWRGDYFDGEIHDFMIFDRALSSAEVHELFA